MSTYPLQAISSGVHLFEKPLAVILSEVQIGGAIKVLAPLEYHTDQQRRWYKGVCLRDLVQQDESKETLEWWDTEVKKKCNGLAYLKKEIFFIETVSGKRIGIGRLTTKGVGKKNMRLFIEEILSKAIEYGWPVSAPDADLIKA